MPLGRLHRSFASPGVTGSPGIEGSPRVTESASAAHAAEHDAQQWSPGVKASSAGDLAVDRDAAQCTAAAAPKTISASPEIAELERAPDDALLHLFARQTDHEYGVYPKFPRHDAHIAAAAAAAAKTAEHEAKRQAAAVAAAAKVALHDTKRQAAVEAAAAAAAKGQDLKEDMVTDGGLAERVGRRSGKVRATLGSVKHKPPKPLQQKQPSPEVSRSRAPRGTAGCFAGRRRPKEAGPRHDALACLRHVHAQNTRPDPGSRQELGRRRAGNAVNSNSGHRFWMSTGRIRPVRCETT